jgi:hypothetical protein
MLLHLLEFDVPGRCHRPSGCRVTAQGVHTVHAQPELNTSVATPSSSQLWIRTLLRPLPRLGIQSIEQFEV